MCRLNTTLNLFLVENVADNFSIRSLCVRLERFYLLHACPMLHCDVLLVAHRLYF